MAGQTFVIELTAGDKIQAYMYTFTGLHDKPTNHLTQFTGLLLKPVDGHNIEPPRAPTPVIQERASSAMTLSVPQPQRARSVFSSERF